jgi:hypothetical protein
VLLLPFYANSGFAVRLLLLQQLPNLNFRRQRSLEIIASQSLPVIFCIVLCREDCPRTTLSTRL